VNNFLTETNVINYKYFAEILNLGNRPIETVEQYRDWVYDWRVIHDQLVLAIHHFRMLKDAAKVRGDASKCNQYWWAKKRLGTFARTMYELRADRKAALKQGKFKQLELA